MEDYYLFSSGKLERKDNTVRLTRSDGKYKDLKIDVTRSIYLFGEVSTNTKCLNYLAQKKFLYIITIIMDFTVDHFIPGKKMYLVHS